MNWGHYRGYELVKKIAQLRAQAQSKVEVPAVAQGLYATLKRERLTDFSHVYNVELRETFVSLDKRITTTSVTLNCHDEASARMLFAVIGNSTHAHLTDDSL